MPDMTIADQIRAQFDEAGRKLDAFRVDVATDYGEQINRLLLDLRSECRGLRDDLGAQIDRMEEDLIRAIRTLKRGK